MHSTVTHQVTYQVALYRPITRLVKSDVGGVTIVVVKKDQGLGTPLTATIDSK